MDSLPPLSTVLAEAWAAPVVLEHPRCFSNMSGASTGMAGKARGWLGLSFFLQSLSSSEHVSLPLFLRRPLSCIGWLDFFTWQASKRAKVEAVPGLLRLRPELSGQQFWCILVVKVSHKATQIQERKIGESTGKALASFADYSPNSPNCGLLLGPRWLAKDVILSEVSSLALSYFIAHV